MINLPLTIAALAWAVSWLLSADAELDYKKTLIGLFVGALLIGALLPTNTWDFPAYWVIAALAVLIAPWLRKQQFVWKAILESLIGLGILLGLAYALFLPYSHWYQQGYKAVDLWDGSRTNLRDYLTVHGLFLFLILSWLAWETRAWMARTPLRALAQWRKWILPVIGLIVLGIAAVVYAASRGFGGAPFAALVMAWSGLLLVKARLPLRKGILLFWVGTAAALTVFVEFIVLRGDISRMNTVFKFYLQAWTLFSISSAVALVWMWIDLPNWGKAWRNGWGTVAVILVAAAFLYPITATPAKMRDRMDEDAPIGIDGMAFMRTSTYYDIAGPMPLEQDYAAITWMQENVTGSPVIVEANTPEYRWGSRFTIYTGLPGVLGWNWHQRQQRGIAKGPSVEQRANDIAAFYTTQSTQSALDFLERYHVDYVIVGNLERQYFASVQPCFAQGDGTVFCNLAGWPMGMPQPDVGSEECVPDPADPETGRLSCPTHGLDKFQELADQGVLRKAYQTGETIIYEVHL